MSKFSELARESSGWKARTPCLLGAFIAGLPADERADVTEAVLDDSITSSAICRTLVQVYDFNISDTSVARHRRGVRGQAGCQCG